MKLRINNFSFLIHSLFLMSYFLLVSCSSEIDVDLADFQRIYFESKSDGSGIVFKKTSLILGEELELFSIEREDGVFVKNISTSWSSSGSIGTLTISPDGKSAKFLALTEGLGKIQILEGGKVVYSIDLETVEVENRIQNFNVKNITSNGFEVLVETEHPLVGSDSATFYYCNNTKIPNCDPKQWYSLEMMKSGKDFTLASPVFKFPDDPKDEFNIVASVTLNTGLDERADKVVLDGPAQIYRSIGVGNTTALETRTSSGLNEASITNSIITFDSVIADNIGIGDCIVVDHNVSAGFENAFFIRKRITGTQYLINDNNGNELSSDFNTITNWEIYRSYTSVPNSDSLTENTGIPTEVSNFDTSRNAVNDNKTWYFAFYADAPWLLNSGSHAIGNWNLFGDNFLRYYVPFLPTEVGISQRHSGVWNSDKAVISLIANARYRWPFMMRSTGRNAVRLEGFQFEIDSNGYSDVYAFRMDPYKLVEGAY